MKHRLWFVLIAVILLYLCACQNSEISASESPDSAVILFYYRNMVDEGGYDGAVQALASETYSYPVGETGMEDLLDAYFSGPKSDDLYGVFPKETGVTNLSLTDGVLTLWLSGDFARMEGMESTLAKACLTMTVTQMEGVDQLCLLSEDEILTEDLQVYSPSDFVLLDTASLASEQSIKLYFADENSRYLLTELRQITAADAQSAGCFIMEQLIQGPKEGGHYPTIPKDTKLIQLSVEDGLCTLDLSAAFLENRPRTEAAEWMTVYSIVNSLTELDEIEKVQFLCEGEVIGFYRYMDLSQQLSHFDGLNGPVRYGLNEFDATVYLGCWSNQYIAAIPSRVRQSTAAGQEAQLLQALLEYEPPAGYKNLIPDGTKILSVDTTDGVCTVDLSDEFLSMDAPDDLPGLRVNALVATLCSLGDVTSVLITVQGNSVRFGGYDLSQPLAMSQGWLFP